MSIDIYHSRRINFKKCRYWLRDERDSIASANKYIYNKAPDGIFYAHQLVASSLTNNQISNIMMFNKNTLVLETDDHISNIIPNTIVEYEGELWIVENIQDTPHLKESQFSKSTHYKYILSLRR